LGGCGFLKGFLACAGYDCVEAEAANCRRIRRYGKAEGDLDCCASVECLVCVVPGERKIAREGCWVYVGHGFGECNWTAALVAYVKHFRGCGSGS
jgi:hypothetical protein